MKLTALQAVELLKAAGLAHAEVVESDDQSEYDRDEALTAIDVSRTDILKPSWAEAEKPNYEKEFTGKFNGTLNRILARATGMNAKEFTEGMSYEEKVKLAMDYVHNKAGEGSKDAAAQIEEIRQAIIAEKDTEVNEWRTKHDALHEKTTRANKLGHLQKWVTDKPIKGDKLVAAEDLLEYLEKDFVVKYDETKGEMGLYRKDNPDMPAMNAANTMPVDLTEYAKAQFKRRDNWAEDTRHIKPADAMQRQQQQQPRQPFNPNPDLQIPQQQGNPKLAALQEKLSSMTQQ